MRFFEPAEKNSLLSGIENGRELVGFAFAGNWLLATGN